MSEDMKPTSMMARLLRGSAYLFGAVILLNLTISMLRELWWVFLIVGIIAVVVIGIRLWRRFKNPWDE